MSLDKKVSFLRRPFASLRASAQGFGSGQLLSVFFCHSDSERSEGEESHSFFYNRNEFLSFAQDDASGDLPPRNDRKKESLWLRLRVTNKWRVNNGM